MNQNEFILNPEDRIICVKVTNILPYPFLSHIALI